MKSVSLLPQNRKRLARAQARNNEEKNAVGDARISKIEKPSQGGSPKMQSRNHAKNEKEQVVVVNLTSQNTYD